MSCQCNSSEPRSPAEAHSMKGAMLAPLLLSWASALITFSQGCEAKNPIACRRKFARQAAERWQSAAQP
eukprot:12916595-Prorocentrum_lima.AAC.1